MSTATAPAPSTALATIDATKPIQKPGDLRALCLRKKSDLEAMYPAAMKSAAARLSQAIVTEWIKSPALQKCTGISLLSCAVQAAQLNLEIGGPLGQAYMVPYGNAAQFQVGYRGLITLAFRSKRVLSVAAVSVHAGDVFEVTQGIDRGIKHVPAAKPSKEITHVYAVVKFKDGGFDFEVMATEDINAHRDRFSKEWKSRGQASVWGQHWEPMAMKTVLRRLLKRCPIGVDLGPDEEVTEQPTTAQAVQIPAAAEHHEPPTTETDDAQDAEFEQTEGKVEGELQLEDYVSDSQHFEWLVNDKGATYAAIVAHINKKCSAKHTKETPWESIPAPHRKVGVEHLLAMPSLEAAS